MSLGLVVAFLGTLSTAIDRKDVFWASMAEVSLIAVSVALLYSQIRKQHEWNRRKASHDFLSELISGEPADLRSHLEADFGVDATNKTQSYQTVFDNLNDDTTREDFYQTTSKLFNFFEQVGIGIKDHMLDEEICFDALHNVMIEYKRWGEPLIQERKRKGRESTWTEFVYYAERWKGPARRHQEHARQQQQRRKRRGLNDVRLPPKGRL